jgi:hypothetical protein
MVNYALKATQAQKLLSKYGQTIVLRVATTGAYNENTLDANVTYADESRKAALFDFDRINFGETFEGTTMILKGDRRCLMDATGTRPKLTDKIVVEGEEFPIHDIKRLSPAGVDVLYDILLRK